MKSRTVVEAFLKANAPPAVTLRIPWRPVALALPAAFLGICASPDASASQLVPNSTGGTMTLGTDFKLTGSTLSSPSGTLSIDCPITSVGGGSTLVYTCTGVSFTFQTTDGTTTAGDLAQTTVVSLTNTTVSGDFAKTGTCPASLGAGKSCTLSVTFTPTATGTRLTFSPTPVIFNNGYIVGDTPTITVTVTNTNGVPAGITGISLSGSSVFYKTNRCGTAVAANSTCWIYMTFIPTAVGTFTGTLAVVESAGVIQKTPISGAAASAGGRN